VLDEDRRAPRKQRHTARRIHRRILTEFPDAAVAESTVRNHVRERKRQLGLLRRETFVPQSYSWAQEAQVDWYEAWVDLGDERTKVQIFTMRSMASGAAFHRANARNADSTAGPSVRRGAICASIDRDWSEFSDVLSRRSGLLTLSDPPPDHVFGQRSFYRQLHYFAIRKGADKPRIQIPNQAESFFVQIDVHFCPDQRTVAQCSGLRYGLLI
jgi:hypothetical protein